MADGQRVVVVGGTSGIGREIAARVRGEGVVILTGREADRASEVAEEMAAAPGVWPSTCPTPDDIAAALADVEPVDHLVLAAIARDDNRVTAYDIEAAPISSPSNSSATPRSCTPCGPRLDASAIVLFGGQAKERPYPGATTVATVNAGVTGLVRTLAVELAPIRVNAVHPGVVGDSPYWRDKVAGRPAVRARTPTGRLATMADVVDAVDFLLRNRSVNAIDLSVDGGWLLQ